MKYVILVLLSISAAAQAQCLHYQVGYQPTQIGNVMLKAPAQEICFESRNGLESIMTLKDEQGMTLASFISDIKAQGRCEGLCQDLEITKGFAYDSDTNPAGTKVSIEAPRNPELGVSMGTLTVQAGKGFPVKAIVIGN